MQIIPREKKRRTRWLLKDDFTDTLPAGSVNGTQATPTGGTRTVTDTNGKLSISDGQLNFVTGGLAYGDPGLWYPLVARVAGRALFAKQSFSAIAEGDTFGFDPTVGQLPSGHALFVTASGFAVYENAVAVTVGPLLVAGNSYTGCLILRATGAFYFIKGGIYTKWTLLWAGKLGTGAAQYPMIAGKLLSGYTADFMRIPANLLTITPIASDAFTRADGALGATGGGGSEEAGGTGQAWTAQLGSWGVNSNAAKPATLGSGKAIATVEADSANILLEATIPVHTALNAGVVLRYVDVDNHVSALITQSGFAYLIKRVAGVDTTMVSLAITEGMAKRLMVSAEGPKFRLYYGDALIGAEQTIADAVLQNSKLCGMYSTSTGNSIDDFVIWPRGTGGEYSFLDKYIGA